MAQATNWCGHWSTEEAENTLRVLNCRSSEGK